jgi:hypothetical protein
MFFSDDMLHGLGLIAALAKNASHSVLPLAQNSPQGASVILTIPYCPIRDMKQC